MNKFTAIYIDGDGRYAMTKMLRYEQKEGETVLGAANRAGYEKGLDYDVADAVVYLFVGHPALQGE